MKGIPGLTRILALIFLLAVAACSSGDGPPVAGGGVPVQSGIVPLSSVQAIFNNNCLVACHQPAGIGFASTGLDLSPGVSYGLLFNQPAFLTPGQILVRSLDGNGSVLVQRLSGAILPQMPLNASPLSAADQNLIRQWIDQGASTGGRLNSVLSGDQISAPSGGPITTGASGTGTLTLNADRTAIDFSLNAGPLANFTSAITGAHIHAQNPGAPNGPIIFDFLPATVPDPLVLGGTLTAGSLSTNQTLIPAFSDAVAALLNGTTYFQIHTVTNGPGELRGHIGTKIFPATTVTGAQIVPAPIVTNASATGTVVINPDQDAISVTLDLGLASNFTSAITQAHIHFGATGTNGPVILDLPLPNPIPANPVVNVVLTAANLRTNQTAVPTFTEAIDALLSGNTYFQVHTVINGPGEIRGQILP